MRKIVHAYDMFEEKFLALQLAISVIVIFVQVVTRYCFNSSLSWSEELARYLYVWQGWYGISLIERKRTHIAIDILKEKFHGVPKKLLGVAVQLICIFAACVMAYVGFQMVGFSLASGAKSTALRLPLAVVYAAMPIGCSLYAIRVFFHMLEDLGIIKQTCVAGEEAK